MRLPLAGLGTLLTLGLFACSSPPVDSQYGEGAFPPPAASTEPNLNTGKTSQAPAKPADSLQACATQTAAAEAKPVYLVVVYDQSGSMDGNSKWTSAKAAMKAFFNGPDAKGISASMSLFPAANNNSCSASAYTTPQVGMTALPSPAFGSALDATKTDQNDRGTPTLAALTGGFTFAKSIQTTTAKDGAVAVVLVTDGVPNKCTGNTVDASVALAKANSEMIPTYVVGVGDKLTDLDKVAAGGGTKSAFVVSINDPAKTQADLVLALNKIKGAALTCDYAIPAPPDGQTFDRAKVNVQYSAPGGAATALDYNPQCAGGKGWKYDDANNPKRILACDNTCDTVKTTAGKVDIVFGCETKTIPVN